jgi:hypothetical protein
MHFKQPQILLVTTVHKLGYIHYHMHSIALTHIHLRTILIHQMDNPYNVKHYRMHINQPQILLDFSMYKHGYIWYHMHSTV